MLIVLISLLFGYFVGYYVVAGVSLLMFGWLPLGGEDLAHRVGGIVRYENVIRDGGHMGLLGPNRDAFSLSDHIGVYGWTPLTVFFFAALTVLIRMAKKFRLFDHSEDALGKTKFGYLSSQMLERLNPERSPTATTMVFLAVAASEFTIAIANKFSGHGAFAIYLGGKDYKILSFTNIGELDGIIVVSFVYVSVSAICALLGLWITEPVCRFVVWVCGSLKPAFKHVYKSIYRDT